MQPDYEADELQSLLQGEYGAPRLDEQFSASLIEKLQAEVLPASLPVSLPTISRRSPLALSLALATVATLILAVVWISNREAPATKDEVTQLSTANSARTLSLSESMPSPPKEGGRVDQLSLSAGHENLSAESEARSESESKLSGESRTQLKASHENDKKQLLGLSDNIPLSKGLDDFPNHSQPWPNVAAMGAASGNLYIVNDKQLYEVNPRTGARRVLGKPEWTNVMGIVTSSDKLYIVSSGRLFRVNPQDGSREVLPSKDESPNNPPPTKP